MNIPFDTWLEGVKSIVSALADYSFQKSAWSGATETSYSSPEEMMCVYFDDLDVPAFLDQHSGTLGSDAVAAGKSLTDCLNRLPWPTDGSFVNWEELLLEPAWADVVHAALSLRERLSP